MSRRIQPTTPESRRAARAHLDEAADTLKKVLDDDLRGQLPAAKVDRLIKWMNAIRAFKYTTELDVD